MHVYTYPEARQKLADVLEQADQSGKVIIHRKDGRSYSLTPEIVSSSPLDIPSIETDITTQEIVRVIRKGRER